MGDVYASAIGTTVMQLKETPQRPVEFDGALVLFGVKVGESEVTAALAKFGTIDSCEVGAMTIVRFATHEAALAAKREGPFPGLCDGIDTHFNERSYDGRTGESGLEDDNGRGWCCFESSVSSELIVRLDAFPRMREALAALPPKMLQLSETHDPKPVDLGSETLKGRV